MAVGNGTWPTGPPPPRQSPGTDGARPADEPCGNTRAREQRLESDRQHGDGQTYDAQIAPIEQIGQSLGTITLDDALAAGQAGKVEHVLRQLLYTLFGTLWERC